MRNKNSRCAQNMLRETAFVCFSKRKMPARVRRYPCRHECSWSCPLPGNQDVTKHSWWGKGKAVGLWCPHDTDKYYPSGKTVFRNLTNVMYLNCRTEALGGLGGLIDPTHEATPRHKKKPDGSPCAKMKLRPRTCSWNDRETSSKAQRHFDPLLVYFIFTSKSHISNLAGSHLLLLK